MEGLFMAYFLKKTKNKKGIYLQIYEGFYDPTRGHAVQRSFRPIGYLDDLIKQGVSDPLTFFQLEVVQLNLQRNEENNRIKNKLISDITPERNLGYFPLKSLNESLGVKKYLDLMQSPFRFKFNVFEVLSSLVYARVVDPCSKYKTFYEVLPLLYEDFHYSESQMYDALEYIGSEYEKIIEIYNHGLQSRFPSDVSTTYFDCTNFYFEIDKEDEFRRNGPSKENKKAPIVSMGLLLDAHQIPIGMKIFPGNESEKPVIREVLNELKERHQINGRIIRVADKGLNCAENIAHARTNGDGYIFSKSIKMMPETEKTWVLLDHDYEDVYDTDGKLLYRMKSCVDDFPYDIPLESGRKTRISLREKRVVTYNPKLAEKKRFEILKQVEKAKRLNAAQAKRNEYGDCTKYVSFKSTDNSGNETDKKVSVSLNRKAIENDLKLAGYNCIVTSELKLNSKQIIEVYRNLWRIEESFRVMKSYLDARPAFVQKQDSIIGHFLICYLSILLLRLLQFNILQNEVSSETIIHFIRNFRVANISDRKWINLTKNSDFIKAFAKQTELPLTSYFLVPSQLKKVLQHRL
jgi:transposase